MVKEGLGKSNRVILGAHNSKAEYITRRYVPYAASEGQSPQTDINLEVLEIEKLNPIADDGTSSNNEDSTSSNSSFLHVEGTAGKPGFISFHGLPYQRREEILESNPSSQISKIFWFIGPTVLVTFLVFPSLYLRRMLSTVFEDSLLTDFLILFFTEALFYCGAAIFFLLVDHIWRPLQQSVPSNRDWSDFKFGLRTSSVATLVMSLIIPLVPNFLILFFTEALFYCGAAIFFLLVDHIWRPLQQSVPSNRDWSDFKFGLRTSSVATLVMSLIIPLVTMGMVWPWTGPAASATLAPYLVGLIVQFVFEHYARYQKSPAWPVIAVIFQVYRLHQLNRAAQLVTALSFTLRGAENTSQTLAINSSLGTLLTVLQILGIICIWSLSSFLMRSVPSSQPIS